MEIMSLAEDPSNATAQRIAAEARSLLKSVAPQGVALTGLTECLDAGEISLNISSNT